MSYTVAFHQINNLAKGNAKNEILLNTNLNTELHITIRENKTIITLPYGDKFDIVNHCIIVYDRYLLASVRILTKIKNITTAKLLFKSIL